jgi:hypothetical protein
MTKTHWTIEELGYTFPEFTKPSEVTSWLLAQGIRGRRHMPEECPIARLLRPTVDNKWPGIRYIGVVACLYEEKRRHIEGYMRVFDGVTDYLIELPQMVLEFVYHFDRGAYPEVEE